MINTVSVRESNTLTLEEFLTHHEFVIEQLNDNILKVNRVGEQDVYLNFSDNVIFFTIDLGSLKEVGSEALYVKLLGLNTEILPVSTGIDSTNPEDPRLVIVESREVENLNGSQLLAVFDALELATDKIEVILTDFVK